MTTIAALSRDLKAFEERLTGTGSPFELEMLGNGSAQFKTAPHTLPDLYRRARQSGDKILIVEDGNKLTYRQFFDRADTIATKLIGDGCFGQRVGLCLRNKTDWLVWFVALTSAGCSVLLVPEDASPTELLTYLGLAKTCLIVSDHEIAGLQNLCQSSGFEGTEHPSLVNPGLEALVAFSSGTTGTPKGIVHSHRSLMAGHRNMMLAGALSNRMLPNNQGGPSRAPAILIACPLSYIAGYSSFLLAMATSGLVAYAESSSDPAKLSDQIERECLSSISGMSDELLRQIIRSSNSGKRLRSLRQLQLHGTSLNPALIAEIATYLPHVRLMTGYGSTELAGTIAAAPVNVVSGSKGKCGRKLPSVELRVVQGGKTLTAGQTGEIEVRGSMTTSGYLGSVDSSDSITPDGWFRTGDIGNVDDDGWLTVQGRASALVNGAQGFPLNLTDIEEVVKRQEGVDDAVVLLQAADQGGGFQVIIQRHPNQEPDEVAIREIVMRLGAGMPCVNWREVESFPRTRSGKIDRVRLSE
ncbi:class I adenylate-forming enzyme family protein [Asticcacaulis sp. SL142]|uniref:class I adenylate-forming enzyme family protein n=1 Tax=Asticcacaulis sp. SL142 TaxID=2995155 RepID=UPI00226C8B6C|nr:class I adenylate-forming enzyme family protein [Asticcacaulis sp. SL142]WAC49757.1 class I adenylate-forming enzyme family protein [Asticcacaulis sp. SL142]